MGFAKTIAIHEAFEFQRFEPIVGWGNDSPGHLLPTDPGRWCSGNGKKWSLKFDDVVPEIPAGFQITSPWAVYIGDETDEGGWEYAVDFNSHSWYSSQGKTTFARRRKWTREIIANVAETSTATAQISPLNEPLI